MNNRTCALRTNWPHSDHGHRRTRDSLTIIVAKINSTFFVLFFLQTDGKKNGKGMLIATKIMQVCKSFLCFWTIIQLKAKTQFRCATWMKPTIIGFKDNYILFSRHSNERSNIGYLINTCMIFSFIEFASVCCEVLGCGAKMQLEKWQISVMQSLMSKFEPVRWMISRTFRRQEEEYNKKQNSRRR